MSGPLSGVKVLELSTFVAAPVCGRLLADLGADVIKVEHPNGDAWRRTSISFLPLQFSEQENPVFDIYNSGKRHVAINLKSPEGMEAFHKLLAQADVFVTNTRPAALQRLGLSYDDLKEKYPSLVYGIVLGYGEKGPDKDMPAFDTTAFWSRSGFLRGMSALSDNYQPVLAPYSMGDTFTGYLLLSQICAALYRQKETGKGDYVRAGLFHNAIFGMGNMQIISQKPFGRTFPMTRVDNGVPGGQYECADGEWIFIATAYAEALIPKLCEAIGRPDVATDPKYSDWKGRWDNRQEYYEIFRDAFLTKTSAEWVEIAKNLDFPLMRMGNFSDLPNDEQAWANGYLEHVTFANGRTEVMPRSPIEMDSVGELFTKPAPCVGAHTEEILKELGYGEEEISAMCADGSVVSGK